MKTIKALHINGFQSHVKTNLQLVEGLNIITGESDSGKTAIIRALKWVLYNNPTGEAFINEKVGQAEVSILFDNNTQIVRVRGKSENYYRLYRDNEEEKLQGFGVNVPAEVINISKMPTALFGEYHFLLSFGLQLEPPFLLSETSGQSARILGKLANTEEIDLAGKDVNSDIYKDRQEKNTLVLLIERLKSEIEQYFWLDGAILNLDRLKINNSLINKSKIEIEQLLNLNSCYIDIENKKIKINETLEKTKNIDDLESKLKDISLNKDAMDILNKTAYFYVEVDSKIQVTGFKLSYFKNLNKFELIVNGLIHKLLDWNKLCKIFSDRLNIIISIGFNNNKLNKLAFDQFELCLIDLQMLDSIFKEINDLHIAYMVNSSKKRNMRHILLNICDREKDLIFNIDNIETANTAVNNLKTINCNYFSNSCKTSIFKNQITSLENQEEAYKKDFEALLRDLQICPVCESQITEEKIKKLTN